MPGCGTSYFGIAICAILACVLAWFLTYRLF
jgi:hypothetical protein